MMDILRNVVFIKNGVEEISKKNFIKDQYEQLVKAAEQWNNNDLVRSLNILQRSLEQMRFASIPALPLELAIVEICNSSDVAESSPSVIARSEATKQSSSECNPTKIASLVARNDENEFAGNDSADSISDTIVSSRGDQASTSDSPDIQKLKEKWTFVLETIRPFNFSLEALLRSINVTECTKDTVIMEVPYSFHQRILESPKNRDLLESILSDILGRSIRVLTVLGARKPKREDIANIAVAEDDEIIRAAAEIFSSDTIN